MALSMSNYAPPRCSRHNEQMIISFYDRPGSPPGNGWVCQSCIKERTAEATRGLLKAESKKYGGMSLRQFYLLKLAEECNEVAQRCSKQMQFGRDEIEPGQNLTNEERLRNEINDLMAVVDILENIREVNFMQPENMEEIAEAKREKIAKYLKYSQELGQVES